MNIWSLLKQPRIPGAQFGVDFWLRGRLEIPRALLCSAVECLSSLGTSCSSVMFNAVPMARAQGFNPFSHRCQQPAVNLIPAISYAVHQSGDVQPMAPWLPVGMIDFLVPLPRFTLMLAIWSGKKLNNRSREAGCYQLKHWNVWWKFMSLAFSMSRGLKDAQWQNCTLLIKHSDNRTTTDIGPSHRGVMSLYMCQ